MARSCFVGVDMGGTNLRSGIIDSDGKVLLSRRAPAMARADSESIVRNIAGEIEGILEDARDRGLAAPRAVGVAVPGPLALPEGLVLAAPHVSAWRAFPLRRRLEAILKRPVVIENDANAWALGELWRGAARG